MVHIPLSHSNEREKAQTFSQVFNYSRFPAGNGGMVLGVRRLWLLLLRFSRSGMKPDVVLLHGARMPASWDLINLLSFFYHIVCLLYVANGANSSLSSVYYHA